MYIATTHSTIAMRIWAKTTGIHHSELNYRRDFRNPVINKLLPNRHRPTRPYILAGFRMQSHRYCKLVAETHISKVELDAKQQVAFRSKLSVSAHSHIHKQLSHPPNNRRPHLVLPISRCIWKRSYLCPNIIVRTQCMPFQSLYWRPDERT